MKATLRNKTTQSSKTIAPSNTDRPARTTRDDFKQEGTIAGLYDLGETIGKGHYAVVKLARHVFTGEKVAVKVIDKSRLDEISKSHLFQEVRCMKLVQHANVVKLYQVIDTQSKLYLILELGDGGDMYDYIMKHEKGLSEELARHYFLQIVNAIDFCHKLHVVHRDLKPENVVFFKKTDTVKLTDFGFSNKFVPGNKLDTSCGSLAYSAPEILLGDSYDAPAVDIWSMGVILYMLVCGQAPFQEANDSETLTMIMDCKYNIPNNISEPCKDLIRKMLVREPCERAKLEDIQAHPWLSGGGAVVAQEVEVPLVCQKELSIDDHNCIVEKMINSNFATVQEISESLSKHKYDHITATYYLLAERLLRKRRGSLSLAMPEAAEVDPATTTNLPDASKPLLSPLALSPRSSNPSCNLNRTPNCTTPSSAGGVSINLEKSRTPFDCLVSPPSSHVSPANSTNYLNRLSSGHQGDDDDEEDDDVGSLNRSKDKLFFPLTFTNLTSASPTLLTGFSQLSTKNFLPPPPPPSAMRPLFSVQSSPQLLNEICEEEGESDDNEDNNGAATLIQRLQMKQSPSYTCGKSFSSTTTAAFATASNAENVGTAENNKLENARKKRFAEKKRAAISRNNNVRNAFNVSSSEDVSDSEDFKQQQQQQPGRHVDRKQQQQPQKDSLQQQHRRQINRLQQNSCKGADFSRKDSSEHSSDTDGPGSFHGRSRNLIDRYHHHHQHHQQQQQQQGTNSGSGNNHERKQPQSENDANDNLSENVSEIDCDEYAEFQRSRSTRSSRDLPQINMLKAALIKLNIACSDDNDDECESYDYDFDDKLSGLSSTNSNSRSRRNSKKLFSVLEENSSYHHQQHQQQHHPLSSLSSSSVSSAFKLSSTSPIMMTTMMLAMRCHERKASSMMNISHTFQCSNNINDHNNADDSLNFLDLHALKESRFSSVFDDKSRSGAWCYNNSATNNIKASMHRSVDCNLNDQSSYSDYYNNEATNYYNDLSFDSKLSWQNDVLGRIGYHDISLLA